MEALLDWGRLAVGSALLAYAAVMDVRTRRVSNRTWWVGGAIGAALLAVDAVAFERVGLLEVGVALAIMALAYALWWMHLLAGGADAKAIMALAVLAPLPPQLAVAGHAWPLWPTALPAALVAFVNSLLFFLAIPLGLLAANAARGRFRFPVMLLGYPLALEEARRSFVWVMDRADEEGHVRLVYFASRFTAEEHAANLERLAALGRREVWVTPKIPYMVPLLAGFVAAWFLGDVFTHWLIEPWMGPVGGP